MPKNITLPILEAFDYLYANNLTIDKLWSEKPDDLPQTHITTKPQPAAPEKDPPPKLE